MSTNPIYDDGTYLANNPNWHQEHSAWKAQQIARILARNSIVPATVCEVGCGAGEILNVLSRSLGGTIDFRGYEISPQAFEICRQKEGPNLHFLLADLLADEVAQFDVAMAIDVFEHIEDYYGFLRKFRAKGTYKVFHIPLDLSVQTVLRGAPLTTLHTSVGHLHFFTKELAMAALGDAGYQIVDWFYTKGSLELPPSWKARLLQLPRRISFSLNEKWTVRILGGFSLLVLAK